MNKAMVILLVMIILLSVTASALPLVVGFCIATDDPEDLLLPTPSPAASQNSEEIPSEGDAGSIKVTLNAGSYEIAKDAAGFEVIQMDGFSLGVLPGDPMLPHRSYDLLVPPDAIGSSLQLKLISTENMSLDGTYNIKPAPPILPGTGGTEILNSRNDSINEVYETAAYFPERPVELLPYSQMRKWKFVRVDFVPFQYNPVTKALILTERAEIEISYTQSSSEIVKSLMSDTVMDDLALQLFLNYDAAMGWYNTRNPIQAQQSYDYVIITTNAIVANSAKLAAFVTHKQKLGHSVLVVTETDFGSLTGQAPNHKAEKIRQWLKNNYAAKGIEYVLLIGDPHPYENGEGDIPMKMCHPEMNQAAYECEQTPTDYFYADLTGNWDIDGDGFYGEWLHDYPVSGGVDFGVDVYVGRIPVYGADYTTLDNILQKIIDYESESAISWRNSILMPMGFQYPGYDGAMLAEQMKDDYLDPNSYTSWRMYQQGNGACGLNSIYTSEQELRGGTVVRNRWAANDYGIVCWWGHGSSTTTWVGYDYCWDGYLLDSFHCSSLDDDHPSFTYQCSCTNGYPENSNNLQYAALKQGGISTVGATRVSWFDTGVEYGHFDGSLTNSGIGYEYVDRLVQGFPGGKALYLTKQSMTPDHQCWLMNWYDFNLYGDPDTSLESQEIPHPNIEVNKTVRDLKTGDWEKAILANVSDELRFKIWVHNNGTGNLTSITVNDTLSVGLEYVTGSATPSEPNVIVPNPDGSTTLYWDFSCPLVYCQNITIEFNATKLSGGKDMNCVNVSGWFNETGTDVQVVDEDCAVVRGQRDDVAIYRKSNRKWYVDTDEDHMIDLNLVLDKSGDIPLVGDINRDGREDVAIYKNSNRKWYVDTDGDHMVDFKFVLNKSGDIPLVGDFNQDGKDDVAIYRNSNRKWYVDTNGDHMIDLKFVLNKSGDIPLVGDFNQDGIEDVAIYRKSNRKWYVDTTGDYMIDLKFVLNKSGDIPLVGDINRDGRDDVVIYRKSNRKWYVDTTGDYMIDLKFVLDKSGDIPLVGAIHEFAIEVNKTVLDPKTGYWVDGIKAEVNDDVRFKIWVHNSGTCNVTNISVNDTLSAGLEYAADKATVNGEPCEPEEISGQCLKWYYNASKDCTNPFMNLPSGKNITIEFNATKNLTGDDTNCVNVSAGYNETGSHVQVVDEDRVGVYGFLDDVAIYRKSNRKWYVDTTGDYKIDLKFVLNKLGDIPVVGDINQDGKDDVAIYRKSNRKWYVDTDGDHKIDLKFVLNKSGDIPLVGDINQDGIDDVAIYRKSNRKWYVDTDGDHKIDLKFVLNKSGDIPLVGDINQDGIDDVAIYRKSNRKWYVDTDGDHKIDLKFVLNKSGDIPLVGDINRDGRDDVAIYRNSNSKWFVDTTGDYMIDLKFVLDKSGDIPLVGDIR